MCTFPAGTLHRAGNIIKAIAPQTHQALLQFRTSHLRDEEKSQNQEKWVCLAETALSVSITTSHHMCLFKLESDNKLQEKSMITGTANSFYTTKSTTYKFSHLTKNEPLFHCHLHQSNIAANHCGSEV